MRDTQMFVAGRSMSLVWALNDYRPADGGPPLMARYAERPDLALPVRALARRRPACRSSWTR